MSKESIMWSDFIKQGRGFFMNLCVCWRSQLYKKWLLGKRSNVNTNSQRFTDLYMRKTFRN